MENSKSELGNINLLVQSSVGTTTTDALIMNSSKPGLNNDNLHSKVANGYYNSNGSHEHDFSLCDSSSQEDVICLAKQDLQLFEHQVSGHGSEDKGLLKHKNGHILKPLQKPPMGTREISFYRQIFSKNNQETEDCYSRLKEFVPKFYGVACIKSDTRTNGNENGTSEIPLDHVSPLNLKHYLFLEDVLQGFKRPCVVDIKLGSKTWSPDATEAKIKQEMSKYKGTKFPLGICLTGMHYYDIDKNEKCRKSKDFCKTLEPLTLKEALQEYFNGTNSPHSQNLAKMALHKMSKIEEIFSTQTSFKLYGSSILIAYDADYLITSVTTSSSRDTAEWSQTNTGDSDIYDNKIPLRVFMIDFAHFHPTTEDDRNLDENYLFGLRNLIKIVCDIAEPPIIEPTK